MTTKQSILTFLEGLDWTSGTQLESQAPYWHTKASTVSRRARELYEGGQLDRKLVKGCVWYKKAQTVVGATLPYRLQLFETTPPRFNSNPTKAK